eukprot:m.124923 g.124923  ORF g.124923 m.124923 type:complete len:353 (-) comp14659_c0_seq6:2-1060(-)
MEQESNLDNFESFVGGHRRHILTSPRSLQICQDFGIKPEDLLPRPAPRYQLSDGEEYRQMAARYEQHRQELLSLLREERAQRPPILTPQRPASRSPVRPASVPYHMAVRSGPSPTPAEREQHVAAMQHSLRLLQRRAADHEADLMATAQRMRVQFARDLRHELTRPKTANPSDLPLSGPVSAYQPDLSRSWTGPLLDATSPTAASRATPLWEEEKADRCDDELRMHASRLIDVTMATHSPADVMQRRREHELRQMQNYRRQRDCEEKLRQERALKGRVREAQAHLVTQTRNTAAQLRQEQAKMNAVLKSAAREKTDPPTIATLSARAGERQRIEQPSRTLASPMHRSSLKFT